MKNQDEQIDKLFSTGIANYEETPSSSAWNSIEGQLPTQSNKKTYWIAASIVAVLITSTVVWNNIITKSNSFHYETASSTLNVNYPQKEFIPTLTFLHSTTIVYVQAPTSANKQMGELTSTEITTIDLASKVEILPISEQYQFTANINNVEPKNINYTINEPITIIYKKGDPRHPKLAKAASYLKQVGDGDRPIIDFGKISTGLIARRESINNSNN